MAKLPNKPNVNDPFLQKWINHVHALLETLPDKAIAPPGPPSGLRVTPGPGLLRVTFTGGQGAESHLLLVSKTANFDPSNAECTTFSLGTNTEFPHVIGIANETRYYWVTAVRNGLRSNPPFGPVKGATLALNSPLVPPPVTKSQPGQLVRDSSGQPTIPLVILTRERNRL